MRRSRRTGDRLRSPVALAWRSCHPGLLRCRSSIRRAPPTKPRPCHERATRPSSRVSTTVVPRAGLAVREATAHLDQPVASRPSAVTGCRRAIRSPVTSRRWCSGFPSRPACCRMVDSDGGIDIQVQPLTGTGGRTAVRAGSPDTGQRAASTNRQIGVDEAAAPKTRFRSPPRCARRRRGPGWYPPTRLTRADSPVSSATSRSIPTPPCDPTPCPYADTLTRETAALPFTCEVPFRQHHGTLEKSH